MKKIVFVILGLCLFIAPPGCPVMAASSPRPNVLMIPIDDMNHWVGHLGRNPQTKTPHIDRLAKMGVAFKKAYCAAPACNPSRIALMSGLRPSTSGCYLNGQDWRPTISEDKLLNQALLDAGYNCYGTGKILHGSYGNSSKWTEYHKTQSGNMSRHPSAPNDGVGGIKFSPLGNKDEDMPDYDAASYGIEVLKRKHDKPFFLAVGLVKPHMPFSVPKKWFDMFPLESIKLPPHREDDLDDIPAAGVKMARPEGDHAQMLESGRWKEAVQAYLATIAFADAQVGRLLDALEKSAYRDNTIICLWSDHGWSLGEKEHWRKFALWEEPTRTVFIWKVPGMTPAGVPSPRPVDFMSIYPTLCALTGTKRPSHVEGLNISPLLTNPTARWDAPALTTHGLRNHALRSEQWRYIRYANGSEELYDHKSDPYEWTNVASDPKFANVKQAFMKHLPAANAPDLPNVVRKNKQKNRAPKNRGKGGKKAKAE